MLTDQYLSRFHGIGRLYGEKALKKFHQSHLLVIGLGGVGSWAAESFARSGVGQLTLMDLDDLCLSNINRQIHALSSTAGKMKTDILAERLRDINPEIKLNLRNEFLSQKNLMALLESPFDYILDACDDFTHKCLLIQNCYQKKIPLLVSGAAGGKQMPHLIQTADITEAGNDQLLARIRKKCRQDYGLPREGGWNITCVFSKERALYPDGKGETCHQASGRAIHMDCETGHGSASFVTGSFAFQAVAHILKQIAEKER